MTERHWYTKKDLEVAAILVPPPPGMASDTTVPSESSRWWLERLERVASDVQALLLSHESSGGADPDPLLLKLASLRSQRDEIEEQMTLLVAFMRERVRPRPYTLRQIAEASGLSFSGARTFYDEQDLLALQERITRAVKFVERAHSWTDSEIGAALLAQEAGSESSTPGRAEAAGSADAPDLPPRHRL